MSNPYSRIPADNCSSADAIRTYGLGSLGTESAFNRARHFLAVVALELAVPKWLNGNRNEQPTLIQPFTQETPAMFQPQTLTAMPGITSAAGAPSAPASFLWGAATAAHQVEGQNLNNDWWDW